MLREIMNHFYKSIIKKLIKLISWFLNKIFIILINRFVILMEIISQKFFSLDKLLYVVHIAKEP